MESEAQCAKLEELGLVDGSITDDSDVFLFGGQTVYRNVFKKSQFVEQYDSSKIRDQLRLTRDRLIQLAMVVGSDYTAGLHGLGFVHAIEIVAEWGTHDLVGLTDFATWIKNLNTILDNKDHGESSIRTKLASPYSRKCDLSMYVAQTGQDHVPSRIVS
jgi:DNA excision repair protein ERCC-5